jgi:small subunit ribosomal protein S2
VIVDLKKEAIGVREANRLGLAVIGLVDTNCDPDEATYVIPANYDAIRSCNLILGALADAVLEGRGTVATPEIVASAEEIHAEEATDAAERQAEVTAAAADAPAPDADTAEAVAEAAEDARAAAATESVTEEGAS